MCGDDLFFYISDQVSCRRGILGKEASAQGWDGNGGNYSILTLQIPGLNLEQALPLHLCLHKFPLLKVMTCASAEISVMLGSIEPITP